MMGIRSITIISFILISSFPILLTIEKCSASGDILYVGSGQNYSKIQDAINDAYEGNTIYVYSGTFNENLVINKPLILTGQGSGSTTIIGANENKHTIKIDTDDIHISGFTIKNNLGSINHYHCIYLNSVSNCTITNNIIKDGEYGIYLVNANENTININNVENNDQNGISLSNSNNNIIQNNIIQNNGNGLYLSSGSSTNQIIQNTISSNNPYGIRIYSSNINTIYLNVFSENTVSNANDPCTNSWSYNSQGNYWDDYIGEDLDDNGIGDSPYDIYGGSNQDLYPLGYFVEENQKPIAYIDSITPNPAIKGQEVNFYGHGTDDGIIIYWEWKSGTNILSNSEDFSSSDLTEGTHTISFRVQDNNGEWSNLVTKTLAINYQESQENNKPIAQIITIDPKKITYGESIYLHGLGTDTDGIITSYSWRSSIDGVISQKSSFSTYELSIGIHTIYFKVKDNNEEWSNEDTEKLIINPADSTINKPPIPDTGGPYIGYVNNVIEFDASKTKDLEGDEIISYVWDLGDGIHGNGVSYKHIYNTSGNYTVRLTVTDSQGKTSIVSTYANITIKNTVQDNIKKNIDSTPGFEILFIFIAICIIVFRKKQI